MNKKITILIISLFVTNLLSAVTAFPGLVSFQQPDGSLIDVYIKGDEKVKWAETVDGYSLLYNSEGYYEYAILDENKNMVNSGIIARNIIERARDVENFLQNVPKKLFYSEEQINILLQLSEIKFKEGQKSFPTTGERELICILMGFADKPINTPLSSFENLFNQVGYNSGGATGSVYDYFYEVSYQQLELNVTVVGPYIAENSMSYYGANTGTNGNDANPEALVEEACIFADEEVNFADYDNDNDGVVDAVYVIYAGVGEEAGGGANAIWAHASSIDESLELDGLSFSRYSTSSEYRGGSSITRIGVICHEFGHVLGAPDFYDTDYSGSGGNFPGTGQWDLQADGSWNGAYFDGATPAHPNAYTKCYIYDWAEPTVLGDDEFLTLLNSNENSTSFYRYDTKTSNEFFLIENRQDIGFDYYVPGNGLLIYHADKTWINTHQYTVNASSHQGLYLVCASANTNPSTSPSSFGNINSSGCAWPYGSKTEFSDETTPNSLSWAGETTAKPLTNITKNTSNQTVTLNYINELVCTPPAIQASEFNLLGTTFSTINIEWTRGDGDAVIVLARKGGSVYDFPENGSEYSANTVFGSGDVIGSDNYVVYNGTGTSVEITNLLENKNYYFAIIEYSSETMCYLTPPLTGSAAPVTEIDEIDNTNNFFIYPNPNNGNFLINCDEYNVGMSLNIYSIDGKLIHSENNIRENNEIVLSNIESGVYIVKIISKDKVQTRNLIIN